jgi:hypothetical protein
MAKVGYCRSKEALERRNAECVYLLLKDAISPKVRRRKTIIAAAANANDQEEKPRNETHVHSDSTFRTIAVERLSIRNAALARLSKHADSYHSLEQERTEGTEIRKAVVQPYPSDHRAVVTPGGAPLKGTDHS